MRSIRIIEPGPLATIQDRGRFGYRSWGVPLSGAMDPQAHRIANLLVGNEDSAAGVEITFGGFQAEFRCAAFFSVAGATAGPILNGVRLEPWKAHSAKEGDLLSIDTAPAVTGSPGRNPASALRTYLAVSGGIDLPPVMGSRSTYLRGGFGGMAGRALRTDDELSIRTPVRKHLEKTAPLILIPRYSGEPELRVIAGPQDDRVSEKGRKDFFSQWYEVTARADRMGISLSGAPIELPKGADIISDGTCPGAVQVHGNGLPTILGADSQTTGGYIKIATVISFDTSLVAQVASGDRVRFRDIDLWHGREIYMQNEFRIRNLLK